MERKIYNDLLRWKKDAYKPLLLYGSKQIGKTYSVIDFGRRCYKNIVYFNTTNNKVQIKKAIIVSFASLLVSSFFLNI